MVSDTVGDFIIQLKNAGAVNKQEVTLPYSKLRHAIADKLVAAGYVESVKKLSKKPFPTLVVTLKYGENGGSVIDGVRRVSKPGRRFYTKATNIYPVKFGKGQMILSTPAGILTGEEARQQNVGGEQLFLIW